MTTGEASVSSLQRFREDNTNDTSLVPYSPSVMLGGAHGLLPPHRAILQSVGWLGYVLEHIDRIEYYNYPCFAHGRGTAIGFAVFEGDERLAQIATSGHTNEEICWTIVHEAGHLAGVLPTGTYYPEPVAEAVAGCFWYDLTGVWSRW